MASRRRDDQAAILHDPIGWRAARWLVFAVLAWIVLCILALFVALPVFAAFSPLVDWWGLWGGLAAVPLGLGLLYLRYPGWLIVAVAGGYGLWRHFDYEVWKAVLFSAPLALVVIAMWWADLTDPDASPADEEEVESGPRDDLRPKDPLPGAAPPR